VVDVYVRRLLKLVRSQRYNSHTKGKDGSSERNETREVRGFPSGKKAQSEDILIRHPV
jgi:hypothetical protein